MGAANLLATLRRAGFDLTATNNGIRVAPFSRLSEADRNAIRVNKPELLALLSNEHRRWLLDFVDRSPAEAAISQPVDFADALAYPVAIAAQPILEPVRGCTNCVQLCKPGFSGGYCGAPECRDDLEPAYGPGHPLRRLPVDAGVSCTTWQRNQSYGLMNSATGVAVSEKDTPRDTTVLDINW